MFARRTTLALAAVLAIGPLAACGAADQPPPGTSPTPGPSTSQSASPSNSAPSASPTMTGFTLRQLGFENGPDEFSLPSDAVISTSVDQPNVVTVVLSRPSPSTVEDYLRQTLPQAGFTIDAHAASGGAMTFQGNGWKGGFTATATTSAIVLRPA